MLGRILIIDDSKMDRFIVEKMVERSKLAEHIDNRELATIALQFIRDCIEQNDPLPDVIFLDINMPEMSGFDFLDRFCSFPSHVLEACSVVMLSSSLNEEDRQKAMSYPCVKMYCSKPISLAKLTDLDEILVAERALKQQADLTTNDTDPEFSDSYISVEDLADEAVDADDSD